MTPEWVETLFTRADGSFLFARWGRPLAPVVFGVDETTLSTFKGAIEAVCQLCNHAMAEMDPELGANLMVFVFSEWAELPEVPNLDRLIPDLEALVERLQEADANQYRVFRFDEAGAIRACFVFLRMDAELMSVSAQTLALSQIVQSILLWSDTAFVESSPLVAIPGGPLVLRPEIAALMRAAYDSVLPPAATDRSHALRLQARLKVLS
jgi:hypothetical protein